MTCRVISSATTTQERQNTERQFSSPCKEGSRNWPLIFTQWLEKELRGKWRVYASSYNLNIVRKWECDHDGKKHLDLIWGCDCNISWGGTVTATIWWIILQKTHRKNKYCLHNNILVTDIGIIFLGLTSSTMNLVSGQRCSQSSNKWKSNDAQSASHRLWVKNPSKVTLDEVQPSERCLFSTKSNLITLYMCVCGAEVLIKNDLHLVMYRSNWIYWTLTRHDGLIYTLWLSFF